MLGDPSWISPQHVHLKENMAAIFDFQFMWAFTAAKPRLQQANNGPLERLMQIINALALQKAIG